MKKTRKPFTPKTYGRFEGLVNQLKKEKLCLVNLTIAKDFAKECFRRKINIGVGDTYGDGVIIVKK